MITDYKKLSEIIKNIDSNLNIYVCGHYNPDFDSICSSLAITKVLNLLNKKAYMLIEEKDMPLLNWYNDKQYIKHQVDTDIDVFMVIDTNRKDRLGIYADNFETARLKINIDHHENSIIEVNYKLVEEELSATCEMIHKLTKEFEVKINKDIATLLYGGIVSDTYCFFNRINSATMLIASELLSYDIDNEYIINSVFLNKTNDEFIALAHMLNNIKYDGFHYIVMNKNDDIYKNIDYNTIFKKLIFIIRTNTDIKLLGMFLITDEYIFGEFRSNYELDIDKLGIALDGGGHKKACGFKTKKSLEEIITIAKNYII